MTSPSADQIQISLDPIADVLALERSWRAIDAQGNHSFFASWDWVGSWLRTLPTLRDQRLLRATKEQKTVGLAILTIKRAYFRHAVPVRQIWFNTTGNAGLDCITIEHNSFASIPAEEEAVWAAFFTWFSNSSIADELFLPGLKVVPNGACDGHFILGGRKEIGLRTDIEKESGDFRKRLTRNSRQQLSRAMRRLQCSTDLQVTIAPDVHTSLRYFDKLKELHTQSWNRRGKGGAFEKPYFEPFCRELIRTGTGSESVQMLRVVAGEFTVGYLMNFLWHGTVYSYQSGLNDAQSELRPGYICHALAIDHYAAKGAKYYDFLAKPNQLKRSFGIEAYEMFWPQVRKPTGVFRAEQLARKLLRKTEFG